MTVFEWACFIAFNVAINVGLQFLAWKIGYKLGEGQRKGKKNERI